MKARILTIIICLLTVLSLFSCRSKTHDNNDVAILPEQEGSNGQPEAEVPIDMQTTDIGNEIATEQQPVNNNENIDTTGNDNIKEDSDTKNNDSVKEYSDTNKNEVSDQKDDISQPLIDSDITDDDITSKYAYDDFAVAPEGTMAEVSTQTSDTFVGKILSSDRIEGLKELPNIITYEDNFYLHKVEVTKTYRSTFVKENTTVYVLHYADPDSKIFSNHFEVGQTYLLTVFPQIYNGGNMLVDYNFLNAHISADGKLTPNSYYSKVRLGDISTVDEFEKDSEVQKELSLPCFYYLHKVIVPVIPDGENQTNSTEPTTKIVKLDRKNFETIATEEEIQQVIEAVHNTTVVNEENEKMYYNFNSSVK